MNSRPRPLILWGINDGRAGHYSQVRGLMTALAHRTACSSHELPVPPLGKSLIGLLRGHAGFIHSLPAPDLIIGAGHSAHLPMLCARRAGGGKAVVLMQPSLPLRWFDACIIPDHDSPRREANVIVSRGPLNCVTPAAKRLEQQGLILVGGPSRHYDWNNEAVLEQIHAITADRSRHWLVSDSPRTPSSMRKALASLAGPGVEYLGWDRCQPGWLQQQLGQCAAAWVSEDSMSMVHEAVTGGGAVGLLEIPPKRASRITRSIDSLADQGLVTRFRDWRGGALPAPASPLNEADRCAVLLLDLLGLY